MELNSVLRQLRTRDPLPVAALRRADRYRGLMAPLLEAEIGLWLTADPPDPSAADPVFFAFHLLGLWGRKSAYPLLAQFLRSPPERLESVLGDCDTESSHRVMAAVFDRDPEPLFGIIRDPHASEYVRSRMFETISMLVLRGELAREPVVKFLRNCRNDLQTAHDSFIWNGWQSAIAMLGVVELKPLVLRAFASGAIDPVWVSVAEFQRDLAYAAAHNGELPPYRRPEFAPLGETIPEMERICAAVGPIPKTRTAVGPLHASDTVRNGRRTGSK